MLISISPHSKAFLYYLSILILKCKCYLFLYLCKYYLVLSLFKSLDIWYYFSESLISQYRVHYFSFFKIRNTELMQLNSEKYVHWACLHSFWVQGSQKNLGMCFRLLIFFQCPVPAHGKEAPPCKPEVLRAILDHLLFPGSSMQSTDWILHY